MEIETIIRILPPVVAILIVLIVKKPIVGLLSGILLGTVVAGFENLNFFGLLISNILEIFTDSWNLKLIAALLLLGAFIGIIEAALYKREVLSKFFNNKKKTLIMGWFTGLLLFVDDYFNILLNGLFLRSFAKKHGISKEKIAFIIHSLGVSACVLIPFSTWTIFIISIINNLALDVNGFSLFVNSIPFNFYSISLILTTLAVIVFEIDVLKMKAAEGNVLENEKREYVRGTITLKEVFIPAIVLVTLSILLIFAGMGFNFSVENLGNVKFIEILILSTLVSMIVAGYLYLKNKILTKKRIVKFSVIGAKQMWPAITIMILAWLLGITTQQVGTSEAVIQLTSGYMTPSLLTLMAFLITAELSFMTSSWAIFAIMIPIMIPLSLNIGVNPSFVLAAIVSGGVFGDHMSPISSTTILTKAVSKSEIHEHFNSQLPYGIVSFVISAYLFFLIGGI